MKPIVKVVCGIIRKEEKTFIARRKPEKSLGGYWEFPGGKINDGEDLFAALQRELLEELGMKVAELKYFGQHQHEYEGFHVELIAVSCDFIEASFEMADHDSFAFVESIELSKFKFAPADIHYVELLKENH